MWKKTVDNAKDAEESHAKSVIATSSALRTRIKDIQTTIAWDEDLVIALEDLKNAEAEFAFQVADSGARGFTAEKKRAEESLKLVSEQIAGIENLKRVKREYGAISEEEAKKALREENLGDFGAAKNAILEQLNAYQKLSTDRLAIEAITRKKLTELYRKQFQDEAQLEKDIVSLKMSSVQDSISRDYNQRRAGMEDTKDLDRKNNLAMMESELKIHRAAAQAEAASLSKQYRESLEYRKSLTEKNAKEERDIRLKYAQASIEKELDYALMSAEDQKKYNEQKAQALEVLAKYSLDEIKAGNVLSDIDKEKLKTVPGQIELQSLITKELEKQAALAQKRDELQGKGKLNFGIADKDIGLTGSEIKAEKIATMEATANVNVTVTPNVGELIDAVTKKVEFAVGTSFEKFKSEWTRRLNETRMST